MPRHSARAASSATLWFAAPSRTLSCRSKVCVRRSSATCRLASTLSALLQSHVLAGHPLLGVIRPDRDPLARHQTASAQARFGCYARRGQGVARCCPTLRQSVRGLPPTFANAGGHHIDLTASVDVTKWPPPADATPASAAASPLGTANPMMLTTALVAPSLIARAAATGSPPQVSCPSDTTLITCSPGLPLSASRVPACRNAAPSGV